MDIEDSDKQLMEQGIAASFPNLGEAARSQLLAIAYQRRALLLGYSTLAPERNVDAETRRNVELMVRELERRFIEMVNEFKTAWGKIPTPTQMQILDSEYFNAFPGGA